MVYIFEFSNFRTLLTWIFETTNMILATEILAFHDCVELPPDVLGDLTVVLGMRIRDELFMVGVSQA